MRIHCSALTVGEYHKCHLPVPTYSDFTNASALAHALTVGNSFQRLQHASYID